MLDPRVCCTVLCHWLLAVLVDQDMPGRLKSPPSTILAFLYLRRTLDIESSRLWIMSSLDLGGL